MNVLEIMVDVTKIVWIHLAHISAAATLDTPSMATDVRVWFPSWRLAMVIWVSHFKSDWREMIFNIEIIEGLRKFFDKEEPSSLW